MIRRNTSILAVFLLLWLTLATAAAAPKKSAKPAKGADPAWNEFVVGSVNDLPKSPIKDFLLASHFNNPYAKEIAHMTKALGPFAPEANNVFWIPTIEMPLDSKEWRFLSSLDKLPKSVMKASILEEGGEKRVRMFLHPFSTKESVFLKIAKAHGGFKYEFQGATTASVRSMIAWQAAKPKPTDSVGTITDPMKSKVVIQPKASIYGANIDGSRLNPAKKLVRAHVVTQQMEEIPESVKKKYGFNFSGEHVVGVPNGTDAGYVVREVLPQFLENGGVEPAFSIMSPPRLTELLGKYKNPVDKLKSEIIEPAAKAIAYLLMEEGMIGENHTQNLNYALTAGRKPTGEVLFHDADAFRTSVVLRALNGKSVKALQDIETPLFFAKDGIFRALGGPDAEGYNLNYLLTEYIGNVRDVGTPAGSIYNWCKKVAAYKKWCTPKQVRELFFDVLAKEISTYVGRPVTAKEVMLDVTAKGKVGALKLFDERIAYLTKNSKATTGKLVPEIQGTLFKEYKRLSGMGYTTMLTKNITPENTEFRLMSDKNGSFITAMSKETKGKPSAFKGVALLHTDNDIATLKFAQEIKKLTGTVIELSVSKLDEGLPTSPIIGKIGGGNNRYASGLAGAKVGPPRVPTSAECRELWKYVQQQ